MEPKKLIATYARVSTARQEEEQTIQSQIMLFKEEAEKKNYHIVKEYTDDGWTSDTLARPGLDQLRADARGGIFEAVLIYDPDRLARRYSYQELILDELREAGIEVLFITVSAPKNSEEKILYGVRGLFAEYERAKITERFRIGKLRKIKEGHILTTEALYGYMYIRKQEKVHGYYEIHPEEARVVQMIFSWIGHEGLTLRKVVRRLQDLAILPRKSKRGVWSTSTLSTLLRHRGYIGEAHYGKSYAVVPEKPLKVQKYKRMKKSSRKVHPDSEWYVIPIPPIIDKNLFDRVQERLKLNFECLCKRNKKNNYLLSNRIWCVCGRKRTGEGPQQGKYLYYRCTDRVLTFPLPPTCIEKGISAIVADEKVWSKVKDLMTSPDLMQEQITRLQTNLKSKPSSTETDISTHEKELEKLVKQEDRYNAAYGAGLFTLEKLKEYLLPIRDRVNAINSQIATIRTEQQEYKAAVLPNEDAILAFAEKSKRVLDNLDFDGKREIIINVIEKIVASQDGGMQVYGHIPIGSNESNVEFIPDYRHGQDTNRHQIPFHFTVKIPPKKYIIKKAA